MAVNHISKKNQLRLGTYLIWERNFQNQSVFIIKTTKVIQNRLLWVVMGYRRVMGTIVEVMCDEKGIVLPESVAPFNVHLIVVGDDKN